MQGNFEPDLLQHRIFDHSTPTENFKIVNNHAYRVSIK